MSVSLKSNSGRPPRRLVVRGVNWLGDAVMTTPAMMRLREALPDTHITLLTRTKLADLWKSHPAIDEVIGIEPGASAWSVGGSLRAHQFDTALVLPNSPRSALEMWMAGIPRRIGHARPWRNWFLTDVVPTRPGHLKMHKRGVSEIKRLVHESGARTALSANSSPCARAEKAVGVPGGHPNCAPAPHPSHQTHEYLHLAAALGAHVEPCPPLLHVDVAEIETARKRFSISGDCLWLGLNAGAEYGPAKRWPVDRFVAAAQAIQQQTGHGWIIFGGPADAPLAEVIATPMRTPRSAIRTVAGQTTLRELMALLKHCQILLTNDTGPMHVAAALGVPVVVPFGSTSPELTGPGLPGDSRHRLIQSDAPCSPCFLRECPIDFRCMNGIGVERVVAAVLDAVR